MSLMAAASTMLVTLTRLMALSYERKVEPIWISFDGREERWRVGQGGTGKDDMGDKLQVVAAQVRHLLDDRFCISPPRSICSTVFLVVPRPPIPPFTLPVSRNPPWGCIGHSWCT
jgi:hypothetical protein